MTRRPQTRKPKPAPQTEPIDNTSATDIGHPVFAQPQRTDDPNKFKIKHPSDNAAYKAIDELNKEAQARAIAVSAAARPAGASADARRDIGHDP